MRCPYCGVEDEFRLMVARVDGCLQCESCGHNAMPLDHPHKIRPSSDFFNTHAPDSVS